jgi:hypothetical protein
MNAQKTLVIFALVAALGLVTVAGVDMLLSIQEAEAGCERGKAVNQALRSSNGKCFDQGTFSFSADEGEDESESANEDEDESEDVDETEE